MSDTNTTPAVPSWVGTVPDLTSDYPIVGIDKSKFVVIYKPDSRRIVAALPMYASYWENQMRKYAQLDNVSVVYAQRDDVLRTMERVSSTTHESNWGGYYRYDYAHIFKAYIGYNWVGSLEPVNQHPYLYWPEYGQLMSTVCSMAKELYHANLERLPLMLSDKVDISVSSTLSPNQMDAYRVTLMYYRIALGYTYRRLKLLQDTNPERIINSKLEWKTQFTRCQELVSSIVDDYSEEGNFDPGLFLTKCKEPDQWITALESKTAASSAPDNNIFYYRCPKIDKTVSSNWLPSTSNLFRFGGSEYDTLDRIWITYVQYCSEAYQRWISDPKVRLSEFRTDPVSHEHYHE